MGLAQAPSGKKPLKLSDSVRLAIEGYIGKENMVPINKAAAPVVLMPSEEDYYEEEEDQVMEAAKAYEMGQSARPKAAKLAQKEPSEADYYEEEEDQVMEAAKAYEAKALASERDRLIDSIDDVGPGKMANAADLVLNLNRARTSERDRLIDSIDDVGPGKMANAADLLLNAKRATPVESQAEAAPDEEALAAWQSQLMGDFEVVHGASYDPNSRVDRSKMAILSDARRKYPQATSNQLALKIYRGEFD